MPQKTQGYTKHLLPLFLFFLCFLEPVAIQNADAFHQPTEPTQKAVVFLLDASNSMNANDPDRLAIDSIAQFLCSLPSNYDAGLIAYNTLIVCATDMQNNAQRKSIIAAANTVQYTGYTNAGEGIARAIALLETSPATEKTIVLLSDGEIVMHTDAETTSSSTKYHAAVETAKQQGIKIHVIGLGSDIVEANHTIFFATSSTGGCSYHAPHASDIQQAIDSILLDQLHIKKNTVAIVNTSGATETLRITMPAQYIAKIRILLTSTAPIQNLNANFDAADVQQFQGTRFSLLEITHPNTEEILVRFQGQKDHQVKVYIIPEHILTAIPQVQYTDTVPTLSEELHYDRLAHIALSFQEAQYTQQLALRDALFQCAAIPIMVNAKPYTAQLQDGIIKFDYPVIQAESLCVSLDFSELATNLILAQPVFVEIDAPPPLPASPDKRPILICSILAALTFVLFLSIYLCSKRVKSPFMIKSIPILSNKCCYFGRLSLHITNHQSDYDIPSLTYNLFRLPADRILSLQDILQECNIKEDFPGAERIFFQAGANHCLVLHNDSECSIMQERKILLKNQSYPIRIHAKIDITFEDETSELTVQYQDSKPNI